MNQKNSRNSSGNKDQRALDSSQERTPQQRFDARQDDFVLENEIKKVLSPYWASSSGS